MAPFPRGTDPPRLRFQVAMTFWSVAAVLLIGRYQPEMWPTVVLIGVSLIASWVWWAWDARRESQEGWS